MNEIWLQSVWIFAFHAPISCKSIFPHCADGSMYGAQEFATHSRRGIIAQGFHRILWTRRSKTTLFIFSLNQASHKKEYVCPEKQKALSFLEAFIRKIWCNPPPPKDATFQRSTERTKVMGDENYREKYCNKKWWDSFPERKVIFFQLKWIFHGKQATPIQKIVKLEWVFFVSLHFEIEL